MRVLVADVERVAVGVAVVAGVGAAWLHRVRDQPVVAKAQRGDVRGAGQRGGGAVLVADAPVVTQVVSGFVVHRQAGGRKALRGGGVDHRRQFVVIDGDQRRRGLRLVQRFGHHHRHPVAHVAHLAIGQHRVLGLLHRRTIEAVDQPAAGQAADGLEVLAGEDAQHAGRGGGGRGVQAFDAGVGIRAAQKVGMGLALQRDVVGVLALAGEEAAVFTAFDRLADETLACVHGMCSGGRHWAAMATAPCCTALTMLW
jgi:hypothetical protein